MSQGFTKDYVVKATGETNIFVNGVKQATTSGSTIDFTIPSGVKRFSVSLDEVSTDSTYQWGFRLGDSGGVETTGYDAQGWFIQTSSQGLANYTDRFGLRTNSAGNLLKGVYEFILHDAATNTWCMHGASSATSSSSGFSASGRKALSSELTTLQLYTTGAFDNGSVNVQYENPDLAISGNADVPAGVTDVFINGVKQASTSGTEIDFTIPAGVKEVKMMYVDLSTTGGNNYLVQLGDSGGVETTGYWSACVYDGTATNFGTRSDGFHQLWAGASNSVTGIMTLTLMDEATNQWIANGHSTIKVGAYSMRTVASKALSGEATTVRLTTVGGTDTFDAGTVNIQYDNPNLDLGSGVVTGGVVQTVHTQDGELQTGTTTLPLDDTIPQNTEGDEYMTASITPTSATNKLRIDVVVHTSHSAAGAVVSSALFQDSAAAALAASWGPKNASTNVVSQTSLTHWMTAGTTDSTTFKVRVGSNSAGTTSFNGNAGARRYGGKLASSITITEYKV